MFKAVGLGKRKPGTSVGDFVACQKAKHCRLREQVMKRVGANRYARRFIRSARTVSARGLSNTIKQ